jgi:hypothetical protein
MKITARIQASFSVPLVLLEKAMTKMGSTQIKIEPRNMIKKNPMAGSICAVDF